MTWSTSTRRSRLPADWTTRRLAVLRRDPRCRIAYPGICTGASTDVDHIRAGDDHSFTNLQGACRPCHKRKTNGESQAARGVGPLRKRKAEQHPGLLPPGG